MRPLVLFVIMGIAATSFAQIETELTHNRLKFLDDGIKRFALKLPQADHLLLNGEGIEGLWKIDQLGNMAGQSQNLNTRFRSILSSPFDGITTNSSGGADPAAILKLHETVLSRFGRIHFNNSFEEYWQIQARATNTDVAGIPATDDLDPEMRFYYYDLNDGEGRAIMSIDGDANTVSVNSIKDACANLHVKQKTPDFPAIAMENNGAGNDIWSFEVEEDNLVLYYDANGDCQDRIAHTVWNPASQDVDVPIKVDDEDPPSGGGGSWQNPAPMAQSVMGKVNQLIPSTFLYNGDPTKQVLGFLPDEVQEVFPIIVDSLESNPEIKTLNYRSFTVLAIKAIQEQQGMIQQLQNQLNQFIASTKRVDK